MMYEYHYNYAEKKHGYIKPSLWQWSEVIINWYGQWNWKWLWSYVAN